MIEEKWRSKSTRGEGFEAPHWKGIVTALAAT
jgi:hypothetical protein